MKRVKWEENYMGLAKHIASWSKDPSSKVGAVVVKNNRVLAVGFNGFPSDVEDSAERLNNREEKYEYVVHAEVNALIVAGQHAQGSTLYVFGRPICSSCAGAIIQSGVSRVVAQLPGAVKKGAVDPWPRRGHIALRMFREAGVSFAQYPASPCPADAGCELCSNVEALPKKSAALRTKRAAATSERKRARKPKRGKKRT